MYILKQQKYSTEDRLVQYLMIGEVEIEDTNAGYLGVSLENNLNWKLQVDHSLSKLSTNPFVIRCLVNLLNINFIKWCIITILIAILGIL